MASPVSSVALSDPAEGPPLGSYEALGSESRMLADKGPLPATFPLSQNGYDTAVP